MLTWSNKILDKIISDVLTVLYQPFWFSVLSAVLFMFFCMYAKEQGWKAAACTWIRTFKTSGSFRRIFCLAFYTMMLNRNMWANPLSDVMGGWTLYDSEGELTTGAIENVMLMLPFTALLLCEYTGALKAPVRCFGNQLSGKGKSSFRTDNECGGAASLKDRIEPTGQGRQLVANDYSLSAGSNPYTSLIER